MPDPVKITLSDRTVSLCRENARKAFIGGRTHVRKDPHGQAREDDQIIGQLGEAALSAFLYRSVDAYKAERDRRNANPYVGDDGDLGMNLDVKASLMRGGSDPLSYRLPVRPKERKVGRVYILGLVPVIDGAQVSVLMVGWCREADLPDHVEASGPFAGAFVVPAKSLRPASGRMRPFEWAEPEKVQAPRVDEIRW